MLVDERANLSLLGAFKLRFRSEDEDYQTSILNSKYLGMVLERDCVTQFEHDLEDLS